VKKQKMETAPIKNNFKIRLCHVEMTKAIRKSPHRLAITHRGNNNPAIFRCADLAYSASATRGSNLQYSKLKLSNRVDTKVAFILS
jgi:hypothetical protein